MKKKKSKRLSFGFVLWILYVVSVNGLMLYLWLRDPSACIICGQVACISPLGCLICKLVLVVCLLGLGVVALFCDGRKKMD